jgi:drug/metabolite transporter (DMT)-like permease
VLLHLHCAIRSCNVRGEVCPVREYSLWSRRAPKGLNGYAALFSSPLDRPTAAPRMAAPAARSRRANASVRRRRVLSVMFAAVSVPALVALATGSMTAWWVVVAMLPFVTTYLAVLFRTRRRMAEREINVAFYGTAGGTIVGLEEMFTARDAPLERVAAGGAISRY